MWYFYIVDKALSMLHLHITLKTNHKCKEQSNVKFCMSDIK